MRPPPHLRTAAGAFAATALLALALGVPRLTAPGASTRLVYVTSPRMPLSLAGVTEVEEAARGLGVALSVVEAETPGAAPLSPEMVSAGATLHYPSLLVYREGGPLGSAILGYKTAAAYRAVVEARLARGPEPAGGGAAAAPIPIRGGGSGGPAQAQWTDFPVPGRPGAYFRWVPGRDAVAYEEGRRIHLLDLGDGGTTVAPGFVDFVPTPDGRFFVTPEPGRAGLGFYDADEVFEAARRGAGRDVEPFYVDRLMKDQYPSVGILGTSGDVTVYRVLTSWFDRVAFRDYEVRPGRLGGPAAVRPRGDVVHACAGLQVSIPIMAQDGRELAARDEASETTKIFRLADGGACTEAADLRVQSGKVAWDPDGRRVAFAIPRGAVRDGAGVLWRGGDGEGLAGIFVWDRSGGATTRVEGSEEVNRLAFPEFVGRDSLLFLIPPESRGEPSRFRLVCCVR